MNDKNKPQCHIKKIKKTQIKHQLPNMAGMTRNTTAHENPYFKNKNNTILRCPNPRICPHKAKYSTHIYFYWWFAHDSYSVFIRYQMSQFLCVTRLNAPQPTAKFRFMPYPLKVYYILSCPNRPHNIFSYWWIVLRYKGIFDRRFDRQMNERGHLFI